MSLEVLHHLAKRAVESGLDCMDKGGAMAGHAAMSMKLVPQTSPSPQDPLQDVVDKVNNPAAIIVLGGTFLLFFLLTSSIEYAIRHVATNLAIVEDDETNGAIKLPFGDEAGAPLMEDYETAVEAGVSRTPITSGIRSTFKYLSHAHGFFSKWRGIGHGIFYGLVFILFSLIFSAFVGSILGRLAAGLITCNLHAAWTHAIIAKSHKPFFQSFLSTKAAKHLMLPTARNQLAISSLGGVTYLLASATKSVVHQHGAKAWALPVLSLLTLVCPFILFFFVVVPSHIALIRSEASLLPDDRSPVVPFDVTFGGRIAWKELDSRKAYILQNLTLRGAYKTFNRNTYIRVVKMSVKLTAIMFGLGLVFGLILVGEFLAFAKKQ